jgi:hypothetical protein
MRKLSIKMQNFSLNLNSERLGIKRFDESVIMYIVFIYDVYVKSIAIY